jgi:hypothetical protein
VPVGREMAICFVIYVSRAANVRVAGKGYVWWCVVCGTKFGVRENVRPLGKKKEWSRQDAKYWIPVRRVVVPTAAKEKRLQRDPL